MSFSPRRVPRGRTKRRFSSKKILHNAAYALLTVVLIAFTVALIARPERYIARCAEGIALWAQCVLPSLFPFMVVCAILINSGIAARAGAPFKRVCGVLKLPPCAGVCFIMGATSGYPAGSRAISQFYSAGALDKRGSFKLACLCTACSPIFLIGTVGEAMFSSPQAGSLLLIAHLISVAIPAMIISLAMPRCGGMLLPPQQNKNALQESFYGALTAALTAGAFIAFFYTAAQMAQDYYILYPVEKLLGLIFGEEQAAAAASGLIEMTGGCAALAKSGGEFPLPLAGFCVTFGGACVLAQQLAYLKACGVHALPFIAVKFLQGIICFFILLIAT